MNHHGLVLFEILEGASLFLFDVISWWLDLLDTGSNSSPEVLDSLASAVLTSDETLVSMTLLRC